MEYRTVCVDLERYELLLNLETRVNVAVDQIARDGYLKMEDLLFTLGTPSAVIVAEKLHKEAEERADKFGKTLMGLEVISG